MNLEAPLSGPFLAIDTGSSVVSVAVGDSDRIDCQDLAVGESSTRLLETVQHLLEQQGFSPKALRGVLCTSGPGSFTGLRIGMATLLGLEASCRVPAVALPSLWVQAASTTLERKTSLEGYTDLLSVLPAHRGLFYCQHFSSAGIKSQGPIATVQSISTQDQRLALQSVMISSSKTLLDSDALPSIPTVYSGPLAASLVRLAIRNPPGIDDVFTWESTTLTKPLYAHTPAVSARPQVKATASGASQSEPGRR